jgi:hypothetical protein
MKFIVGENKHHTPKNHTPSPPSIMSGVDACTSNNIPKSTPVPTMPAVPQAHASAVIELPATVAIDPVSAKDFYNKHNHSMCALLTLCYGLNHDDGMPAIDVSVAPWSMIKICTSVGKDYQAEISYRWCYVHDDTRA